MKTYLELKLYNIVHDIFIINLLLIMLALLIVLSFKKVNNYHSYSLIKNNNSYYIVCNNNCNLVNKNNKFYINNTKIKYKIFTHANNLFEVKINRKLPLNDLKSIAIKDGKIMLYKKLFNIFKGKE